MSTQFHCDDTETLVAYLYDDIDPVLRESVARHLPGCARCVHTDACSGVWIDYVTVHGPDEFVPIEEPR